MKNLDDDEAQFLRDAESLILSLHSCCSSFEDCKAEAPEVEL